MSSRIASSSGAKSIPSWILSSKVLLGQQQIQKICENEIRHAPDDESVVTDYIRFRKKKSAKKHVRKNFEIL
jgi:hypothetical protein